MSASQPSDHRRQRRRALFALVIMAGMAELAYAIVNFSAMPPYLRFELGLGAWVGAIGAAFLLVETALKSPLGLMSDRWGRKPLLLLGPLISMITAPLTVLFHVPIPLLLLRAIDGVGAAALWPTAFATVADVADPEERATAMSLFNVTYLVGVAMGPLLGGLVNDYTGHMTSSFWLAGLLFAVTALIGYLAIPRVLPRHHTETHHDAERPHMNLREIWEAAKLVPDTLVLGFFCFLSIGLVMLLVKLFAMEVLHLSESGYGLMLLPPALVFAVFSVPAGKAADTWGKRRAMRVGMTLCCLGMWGIPFTGIKLLILFSACVVGLGYILAIPAWMAIVSEIGGARRGAVMGAVFTAQGVGAMIGAPLGSWLYDRVPIHIGSLHLSSHHTPFVGCCVILTITWLLTLWRFRDRPIGERQAA